MASVEQLYIVRFLELYNSSDSSTNSPYFRRSDSFVCTFVGGFNYDISVVCFHQALGGKFHLPIDLWITILFTYPILPLVDLGWQDQGLLFSFLYVVLEKQVCIVLIHQICMKLSLACVFPISHIALIISNLLPNLFKMSSN